MKIFLLLFAILPLQATGPVNINETVIFHRMDALLQMRTTIMEKAWPETTGPLYEIPLIYYTDSACYVANPTARFMRHYQCELKYKTKNLTIFKVPQRMDNIPFHMEVVVGFDEKDFNYQFPYGRASGFEETRKYAPDLPPSAWCGMVLHELFHGYQFRHREYWQYAMEQKFIYAVINDSLQSYYNKHDWYKKSVDEENELILQAIAEKKRSARKKLVLKMFTLRDDRRKQAENKIDRPVGFYESSFETMEGTARYIEEATASMFSKIKLSEELLQADTSFRNGYFLNKKLYSEAGYKTAASQKYTYAIGYNMARLLDAFGSRYKSRLFKEPALTLEKLLREEVAK